MIKYKKLRDGGWGVIGPASEVTRGAVTVHKAAGGTKTEQVERVSKPFDVNGIPYVIGFIAPKQYGCSCESDCCRPRCRCESQCNCRGGNIYDC